MSKIGFMSLPPELRLIVYAGLYEDDSEKQTVDVVHSSRYPWVGGIRKTEPNESWLPLTRTCRQLRKETLRFAVKKYKYRFHCQQLFAPFSNAIGPAGTAAFITDIIMDLPSPETILGRASDVAKPELERPIAKKLCHNLDGLSAFSHLETIFPALETLVLNMPNSRDWAIFPRTSAKERLFVKEGLNKVHEFLSSIKSLKTVQVHYPDGVRPPKEEAPMMEDMGWEVEEVKRDDSAAKGGCYQYNSHRTQVLDFAIRIKGKQGKKKKKNKKKDVDGE